VTLSPGEKYASAQVIYLSGSKGSDVSITSGVTLGGATINEDASWKGQWQKLDGSMVEIPAGSAAIVKLMK